VGKLVRFRRQKIIDEGVNLTPLLDVVFLLLIFFMVSTTFTKETHLNIDIPEASAEPQTIKSDTVEIVIQANGEYAIDGQALINKQRQTLYKALDQAASDNNEKELLITADANASHQSVVTVMDVAGKLGFRSLRITTREPQEQ
jgi:biopolymer transport protein ExbD